MDKKKLGKTLAKVGTGFMVFAGTLVGGYALTPNKVRTVNLNFEQDPNESLPSHFQEFVTKVSNYPDVGLTGLHADFENFSLQFKTSDTATKTNTISLDADLDLVIRSLSDLDLSLIADVNYNGRELPLVVGYVDKTVYFGLKDLRLKCTSTNLEDLADVVETFFNASVEEGGLGIDPIGKLEDTVNEFFSTLDVGSLLSSFTSSTPTISTDETQLNNGDWKFDLHIGMEDNNFDIVILTTEDYDLKRVDLGTISVGNFTVKGAINFEIRPLTVIRPDDPAHPKYDENKVFHEVIGYRGWIKKLADFLADDNQKMSLSFELGLSNGGRYDENTNLTSEVVNIGAIKGDINLDASQLIDLSDWVDDTPEYNEDDQPDFENMPSRKPNKLGGENEESLLDKVLNGIKLGIDVKIIGQNNVEYSNLNVSYLDNAGYIKFNEKEDEFGHKTSVMKAKVEAETINWMLNEMPDKIKDLTSDMDTSALSGLFSDITESSLITDIKAGDYSGILDVLETLRNDSDKIYLGLNLSSLGLGENARVNLVLDSYDSYFDDNYDPEHPEEHKILNLQVRNIELGDFNLNFDLVNDEYQPVTIDAIDSYDSLSFLPTVFDQVTDILNTKQSGFAIEGSVLDVDNLGVKINGQGQFDYNTKYGFGSLTIDQYKYRSNKVWYSHKIALDVDDKSNDRTQNNAKVIYGDVNGQNIKARTDLQSVLDIIDVVKAFINDNKDDSRFSKFIDPIMEMLGMETIAKAIDDKDYFRLTNNDLLKEIKQYEDGRVIRIVVGGDLFGLTTDIDIRVNFESVENRVIDSLEVKDLKIGDAPEAGQKDKRKTLNLKISLEDFVEQSSTVPENIPNNQFIDLSSVKFLLEFGLNDAKLGYFNLTADISLKLGKINIKTFPINFHVVVKQSYVKVYGVIENVPNFSIAVQDHLLSTKIKSEMTFETYDANDPHKTNDVGGYFSIRKTTDPLIGKTDVYNYRSTSANFIKGNSLIYYLLNGMLDVKESYISENVDSVDETSVEKEPGAYTNVFTETGFQYNSDNKSWKLGINLGDLINIKQLSAIEAEIYTSTVGGKTYLSELKASLVIDIGLKISANVDLKLNDIDPSVTDWSHDIQVAFNKINSYVYPSGVDVLDKLTYYQYKIK